jgi:hypothetical protein
MTDQANGGIRQLRAAYRAKVQRVAELEARLAEIEQQRDDTEAEWLDDSMDTFGADSADDDSSIAQDDLPPDIQAEPLPVSTEPLDANAQAARKVTGMQHAAGVAEPIGPTYGKTLVQLKDMMAGMGDTDEDFRALQDMGIFPREDPSYGPRRGR